MYRKVLKCEYFTLKEYLGQKAYKMRHIYSYVIYTYCLYRKKNN